MNKHQFLAELSQYLTFLSPESRTKILEAYAARFDALSPEEEHLVIAGLGSPMRTAIELKRRLEAGERLIETESDAPEDSAEEASDEAAEEVSDKIPEEVSDVVSDEAAEDGSAEAEPQPEATEGTASKIDDPLDYNLETETEESLLAEEPEEAPEAEGLVSEKTTKAAPVVAPRKVSGAKLFFGLLGASLLSLVIAALFLGLGAVGGGFFVAAGHLLIAGLKSLNYLTTALLLFAGGLAALALGLLILWFSIWAAIRLIGGLFRRARGTGPRHTEKEAKQK